MVSLHPLSIIKKNERKNLPKKKIDKKAMITPLYQGKETPCDTCLSGSMTVEAAWILPICVCFFVCLLFLFRVMQVQIVMQRAVTRASAKLAVAMAEDDCQGQTMAWLLLGRELSHAGNIVDDIDGGMMGIRLTKSDWDKDRVSLVADYQMTCPITVFGKIKIPLISKAVCHKWIGYTAGSEGETDHLWVYVTQTGTVYHQSEACSHLNLSIQCVPMGGLGEMRNEDGGKYYPCRRCATGENPNQNANIFITNQGNAYHYKLQCSGLKRTVYRIRLSAVGDRSPCRRCGGA